MLGIFDSGSGGLTVASAIRRLAPNADILYFADLANAPYGNRSTEELKAFTDGMIQYLHARGATTIVSACNSVSASVLRPDSHYRDIIEMVGPAVDGLIAQNLHDVAVLATVATCRSGMYRMTCQKVGINTVEIACPNLAAGIEASNIQLIDVSILEALQKIPSNTFDVLLACTHYPLVIDRFKILKPTFNFINPAEAVARVAIKKYGIGGRGQTEIVCTKRTEIFERFAEEMLGANIIKVDSL